MLCKDGGGVHGIRYIVGCLLEVTVVVGAARGERKIGCDTMRMSKRWRIGKGVLYCNWWYCLCFMVKVVMMAFFLFAMHVARNFFFVFLFKCESGCECCTGFCGSWRWFWFGGDIILVKENYISAHDLFRLSDCCL